MRYYISITLVLFAFLFFFGCGSENPKSKKNTNLAPEEVSVDKSKTVSDITLDRVMGKFNPPTDEKFTLIEAPYAGREDMYLHKETYAAFKKMHAAANADGIKLIIRSATRNFLSQKFIWEGKWTGRRLVDGGENLKDSTPDPEARALKILRWSSMPGTSRHHWGTDIDLNAFTNDYFEHGEGYKVYNWLKANAHDYGFCQPYSEKGVNRPDGYNEERWHWSYMPLARKYMAVARQQMSNEAITGFEGSSTAGEIDVVGKYVFGIDKACH